MKLYIATTPDVYELPVAVADSAQELARLCGCKTQQIYNGCHRQRKWAKSNRSVKQRKETKYKFFTVEVE